MKVDIKQHFMVSKIHNSLLLSLFRTASLRWQMGNCMVVYFYIKCCMLPRKKFFSGQSCSDLKGKCLFKSFPLD